MDKQRGYLRIVDGDPNIRQLLDDLKMAEDDNPASDEDQAPPSVEGK